MRTPTSRGLTPARISGAIDSLPGGTVRPRPANRHQETRVGFDMRIKLTLAEKAALGKRDSARLAQSNRYLGWILGPGEQGASARKQAVVEYLSRVSHLDTAVVINVISGTPPSLGISRNWVRCLISALFTSLLLAMRVNIISACGCIIPPATYGFASAADAPKATDTAVINPRGDGPTAKRASPASV